MVKEDIKDTAVNSIRSKDIIRVAMVGSSKILSSHDY